MIKIRYRDPNELSPGLHAAAECNGRSTTVYLLSGLTATERRAALRRLRLSARMGHCPALPVAQLALALLADRISTGAGHAGAVFRSHPAGSTVPVMVVSAGAIAFLLFSPVSIRVLHQQRPAGQLPPAGPVPSVTAIAEPITGVPQPAAGGLGQPGSRTGQLTPAQAGAGGPAAFTSPTISGFGTGTGNPAGSVDGTGITSPSGSTPVATSPSGNGTGTGSTPGTGTGTTSGTGSGTTSGTGTTPGSGNPTGTPVPPTSPASPGPIAPTATPAPSSGSQPQPIVTTGSGGGPCVDLGLLGVCLNV